MQNLVITEEVGVQLTDKYDVYPESCDYFNARCLFHSGFHELEPKQRMLENANWAYREDTRYSWNCYGCLDENRGVRIGLCMCIASLFTLSTIIICASQTPLNVLLSIIFYLITFCLLICFAIRCRNYIEEYAVRRENEESLLKFDDFTTSMTRSGGLYFDEKIRRVYDMTVLVNYSESTEHEIIYIQRKQKLFDFEAIIDIGFNEASNEPDWSEYKLYESLPSYSYNVNENDYCSLIIKYRETAEQKRVKKRKSMSLSVSMSYPYGVPTNEEEVVGKWHDRKCSKADFMEKIASLQRILDLVGLSDKLSIRKEPYQRFHNNPVTKH